jgi:hypothetical protein
MIVCILIVIKSVIFLSCFCFYVWLFYVVEFSIELSLVVDNVFYVCVYFLGDVFVFVFSSSEEEVGGFDLVSLCH